MDVTIQTIIGSYPYSIKSIAYYINSLTYGFKISELQSIRKKITGLSRTGGNSIFAEKSIIEDENYAFHIGGRTEPQFNIAIEEGEGTSVFRFGLGFSLQQSHTLPDPLGTISKYLKKANIFLDEHKEDYLIFPRDQGHHSAIQDRHSNQQGQFI